MSPQPRENNGLSMLRKNRNANNITENAQAQTTADRQTHNNEFSMSKEVLWKFYVDESELGEVIRL